MKRMMDSLVEKALKFTALDFALLKICVGLAGVLLGTYNSKACKKISPLLWVGTIGSYAALLYRMFLRPEEEKSVPVCE